MDKIVFDLSLSRPTVRLEISNTSTMRYAFKVMATRVTRYYVSPAQCTIPPHSSKVVSVFIPDPFPEPLPKEVESEAYDRDDRAYKAYIDGADKFMMVMVALDSEVEELGPNELAAVRGEGGGGGIAAP